MSLVQSQLFASDQNLLYEWLVGTSILPILTLKGCPVPVEQEKLFVTPSLSLENLLRYLISLCIA